MKTISSTLVLALVLLEAAGCQPRKVPEAPDPIPDPPGDPNQPVPNPAAVAPHAVGPGRAAPPPVAEAAP